MRKSGLTEAKLKKPTKGNISPHPSCSYLTKILTVSIKLMLVHGFVYSELCKGKLKPEISQWPDLNAEKWNSWDKSYWKNFRSHQHICKCLEINTAQARAVNKDERCSQLLYHLSIWSTTVNAKFSSCKIDVNECLLQKRLKSEYLLNGMLLRQSDKKRDFRIIVQKSPKSTAFFAAAVGLTDRIPASLWKKCSQCFRKMHLLLFKSLAKQ